MIIEWIIDKDYLIGTTKKFSFKSKLTSFDLDGTLIDTKSGSKYPLNKDDWKIKKNVLQKFPNNSIIFSNQGFIINHEKYKYIIMKKINNIINILNKEVKIFIAISPLYRKPLPTMFFKFVIKYSYNGFYCGDMDTDYKFALNCNIDFITPEQFFLNNNNKINKIKYPNIFKPLKNKFTFIPQDKELIVLIGLHGSGKTYIANILKKNYDYNDNQIIDNTNHTIKLRKKYINLALKLNIPIRAIYVSTPPLLSKHNCYYRYIKNKIPFSKKNIIIEKPTLNEGFNEILEIKMLSKPNDLLYYMFLF